MSQLYGYKGWPEDGASSLLPPCEAKPCLVHVHVHYYVDGSRWLCTPSSFFFILRLLFLLFFLWVAVFLLWAPIFLLWAAAGEHPSRQRVHQASSGLGPGAQPSRQPSGVLRTPSLLRTHSSKQPPALHHPGSECTKPPPALDQACSDVEEREASAPGLLWCRRVWSGLRWTELTWAGLLL
ncbi:hypothetical protein ACLB2K_002808 [Fragaria x ananassa]